jgi:four helix bundle protein
MKQPSDKRQRTLDLQARATRFSAAVNSACPEHFRNTPSTIVWNQLVRAADSTSNNLVEADDASSDAGFLHKMATALREAKESRTCLTKLRLSSLQHVEKTKGLEQEADELAAIFATIIINRKRNIANAKAGRRG